MSGLVEMVAAARAAHARDPRVFPEMTVFNDEEADVVLLGMAGSGIPYRLSIIVPCRAWPASGSIADWTAEAYAARGEAGKETK